MWILQFNVWLNDVQLKFLIKKKNQFPKVWFCLPALDYEELDTAIDQAILF